jgi:tetratricopeptide (TPR) repeat protein
MATIITTPLSGVTPTPPCFNGEEPVFVVPATTLEFHHYPEGTPHTYANSPARASHSGEDKAKTTGNQRLGGKKRTFSNCSPAGFQNKKSYSISLNQQIDNARMLFNQKSYQASLIVCERILTNYLNNQIALYIKSNCYSMLGDFEKAKGCLDDLIRIYPNDARAVSIRGAIWLQEHQYPEALADLKKSCVLDTSQVFVEYSLLSDCYFSCAKDPVATAFHLQRASYHSERNPLISTDDLYVLRGIFLASQNNYSAALRELSMAVRAPSNTFALKIFEALANNIKRRRHVRTEKSVTLPTGLVPISVLLNKIDIEAPRADL